MRQTRRTLKGLQLLQERYSDPILTGLTVLLLVMMFVIAPLQAADVIVFEAFGLVVAIGMVLGVLVMSRSPVAFILITVAVAMNAVGAVLRFHQLSTFDVYLVSAAWLLMAMTLGWVVAGQVFAKGRELHRVIGAVSALPADRAVLRRRPSRSSVWSIPNAFQGIKIEDLTALASNLIYFSFVTLTSTGYGDVLPVHPIAGSLCNVETIIGQLYPPTLLARLVSLELKGRK